MATALARPCPPASPPGPPASRPADQPPGQAAARPPPDRSRPARARAGHRSCGEAGHGGAGHGRYPFHGPHDASHSPAPRTTAPSPAPCSAAPLTRSRHRAGHPVATLARCATGICTRLGHPASLTAKRHQRPGRYILKRPGKSGHPQPVTCTRLPARSARPRPHRFGRRWQLSAVARCLPHAL